MIKTELQGNSLDLRTILDMVNNLPNKGSGTGEDISEELTAQDAIIADIQAALDEAAVPDVAESYAVIGVTYPEGSVCTCTDGQETLTAKNTSGQCIFYIPYVGTWIVSCTDDTNTKSETVEITAECQLESVALSYRGPGELYKLGDTSGWQARAVKGESGWTALAPTLSMDVTGMNISWKSNSVTTINSGVVEIAEDIDLTPYTTLKVVISATTNNAATLGLSVFPRDGYPMTNSYAKSYIIPVNTTVTEQEITLDISGVNLSADIGFVTRSLSTTAVTATVLSVELL